MRTKGQAYVVAGQQYHEERNCKRVVQNLAKRAHQLGFELTPPHPAPHENKPGPPQFGRGSFLRGAIVFKQGRS
jgi:hypothetical protein